MKQHNKLLLALVLGGALGLMLHGSSSEALDNLTRYVFEPTGQIFLRLIFMVVVPIVVCGLILGVYELSSHRGLGRVVRRTLIYTLISSTASVIIGVSLVQIFRPGDGVKVPENLTEQIAHVEKIKSHAIAAKSPIQSIIDLFPKNPIASAVQALDGEMLALMVFSLIFGLALSVSAKKQNSNLLIDFFTQVYSASMEVVHFAMRLAPYAVFALIFTTCYKMGAQVVVSLGYYVLIVLLGLALQNYGVYSILLKLFARKSPIDFFKKTRDVLLYAFATASSNATLPRSLETATEKLKLSPESSRFVLTVGSTANQNGTALFEGITVLFLAQVYSIDLTLGQQVQVVFMSILAGIGTAGVPGGSLPLIMILLQQMGIPPEGLGIILGVDRLLDMARTAVNVSGDLVIAQLVEEKK